MKQLGKRGKEDDTQVLRNYLEQFRGIPILDGTLVQVVIPAGDQYVLADHGLGRAYRGGLIAGVSFATTSWVQEPQSTSAAGVDITRQFLTYIPSAVGYDVTINVWVF